MKNIIKSTVLTFLVGLALSIQSCNNNAPGLANVNMEMKAVTAASTIAGGRVTANDIVYTQVLIGVTEIELETLEENEAEDKGDVENDKDGDGEDDNEDIEFKGEYTVDLIAGTSTPDFGDTDIAPGLYEEIEIDLAPIMADGNTMFIAFDFTPTGASAPVKYEYSNTASLEYELESDSGIELTDTGLNQLLIVLDLDALFAGVDLSSATADTDGVVRINDKSNANLALQIAANLDSVMEGGEDDDNDGEFDD
jgi:hypothetical protein